MKEYQFTRKVKYVEYGAVTAENKEEAIKKIKENDYDDVFDTSLIDVDNDTIIIRGD